MARYYIHVLTVVVPQFQCASNLWIFKISGFQISESLKGLLKQIAGLCPYSLIHKSGKGLRICISNRFPGDGDGPGPGTTL